MRVTGGIYRSRTVAIPKGIIRPAMDRMRESVFAIIGQDLSGCSFLDLFSGSGIIGIEAASRGASPVVLVEMDRKKRSTIMSNISFVESEIQLFTMSANAYLSRAKDQFDFIFLDPPFKFQQKEQLITKVDTAQALAVDGLLLMHHPKREEIPKTISGLSLDDSRAYGGSEVLFYRKSSVSGQ